MPKGFSPKTINHGGHREHRASQSESLKQKSFKELGGQEKFFYEIIKIDDLVESDENDGFVKSSPALAG